MTTKKSVFYDAGFMLGYMITVLVLFLAIVGLAHLLGHDLDIVWSNVVYGGVGIFIGRRQVRNEKQKIDQA